MRSHSTIPLLCLFLALLVPTLCRGEGMSLEDSPDWRPMSEAQQAGVTSIATKRNLRVVNASLYTAGGGAVVLTSPLAKKLHRDNFEHEVLGFIHDLEENGAKMLDRQPANVASLPGFTATFQGKTNGQDLFMLVYGLFSERDVYSVNFYTPKPLARTDPMVTSYLARIRLDSTVVPAALDQPAAGPSNAVSGGVSANPPDPAYALGKLMGYALCVIAVVVGIVTLVARGNRRGKGPPLPPP